MKGSIILLLLSIFLLPSNTEAQKRKIIKGLKEAEEQIGHHAGFYLYDPARNKVLVDYKGDKYFTPASNTKIFTFYTSLKVLGDSIPGLYYKSSGDTLYIWGSGDPSLFYERVAKSPVADFIKDQDKTVILSDANFKDTHFGEAWAWDDFAYSYQVEKAPLPVFGNYYYVSKKKGSSTLEITHKSFKKYFTIKDSTDIMPPVLRDYGSNRADYFPRSREDEFNRRIPFKYTSDLAAEMLSDTLGIKIHTRAIPLRGDYQTVNSVPADSLYKVLMQRSDNFIAEQLMLTVAGKVSDTLNTAIGIKYSKENFLTDLPDEPLWFDGSGLSRYNQFTPRSIVRLWEKIYREFDQERIFPLLAIGGQTGTISSLYKGDPPYVYGKTGTLRNHHCLSGFVLTDKGNTLIFSFMNGHYPGGSSTVKEDMERILLLVKERY